MVHKFKEGERIWINLVDEGPEDLRRATATGKETVDIDPIRRCWSQMSEILIDGLDRPGFYLNRRLTRMSVLDLLAEA